MIFPYYLRNFDSLRNEEEGASAPHKKTKKRLGDIFLTMEYHVYW